MGNLLTSTLCHQVPRVHTAFQLCRIFVYTTAEAKVVNLLGISPSYCEVAAGNHVTDTREQKHICNDDDIRWETSPFYCPSYGDHFQDTSSHRNYTELWWLNCRGLKQAINRLGPENYHNYVTAIYISYGFVLFTHILHGCFSGTRAIRLSQHQWSNLNDMDSTHHYQSTTWKLKCELRANCLGCIITKPKHVKRKQIFRPYTFSPRSNLMARVSKLGICKSSPESAIPQP